eukprot:COSAG01_NODE_52585_length_345_cov_2.272358_1_plen_56_part_01
MFALDNSRPWLLILAKVIRGASRRDVVACLDAEPDRAVREPRAAGADDAVEQYRAN